MDNAASTDESSVSERIADALASLAIDKMKDDVAKAIVQNELEELRCVTAVYLYGMVQSFHLAVAHHAFVIRNLKLVDAVSEANEINLKRLSAPGYKVRVAERVVSPREVLLLPEILQTRFNISITAENFETCYLDHDVLIRALFSCA
jgi:hypothetical protein